MGMERRSKRKSRTLDIADDVAVSNSNTLARSKRSTPRKSPDPEPTNPQPAAMHKPPTRKRARVIQRGSKFQSNNSTTTNEKNGKEEETTHTKPNKYHQSPNSNSHLKLES